MDPQIDVLHLGVDNVYVVRQHGTLIVDGGQPGRAAAFARGLQALSVRPNDVRLILLTHGHWDHVGCASAMKRLTGAPIAMHHTECQRLEHPRRFMPPGVTLWGKILGAFCSVAVVPLMPVPAAMVDLIVTDEGLSLEPFGIRGQVLHTPGHSPGSLTVLLDTGDALVGDLAMNSLLLRVGPCLPVFAEELPRLKGSIEKVISRGAKTIYPAHGGPFPVELLEEALQRL